MLNEAVIPESMFLWQAFHYLRTSRPDGIAGSGAIPFGAIVDYCTWAGITCPVTKTRVAKFVITLDNVERSINAKKEQGR